MDIQIIVPNNRSSSVLGDLAKRRAEIKTITIRGENKVNISSKILFFYSRFSRLSIFHFALTFFQFNR